MPPKQLMLIPYPLLQVMKPILSSATHPPTKLIRLVLYTELNWKEVLNRVLDPRLITSLSTMCLALYNLDIVWIQMQSLNKFPWKKKSFMK